jgi:hypothetical protein
MRRYFRPFLLSVTVSCVFAADPLTTLIQSRVLTLPPDLPRSKVYPDGAVVSGDVFKNGKKMVVAVAVADHRSLGLALFIHKNGDWREITRQSLMENDQRLGADDEWPFTFADLDGDAKPELLLTERGGGGDRLVRVYHFAGETETLTLAGSGLRNPTWKNGAVRGQWKIGATAGDIGAEQHQWVDGRLQPSWRSSQHYVVHEYVIGSGEPAVRVELETINAAGVISVVSAAGNLASFRNLLPIGEQPRPFQVLIREAKGRRLLHISPKADGLRTTTRQNQWDEMISRAVFTDPAVFSGDMSVTMDDGTMMKLAEVASVTVLPSTITPTYQFISISDEAKRVIEEPVNLPALAVANPGNREWTLVTDSVNLWATSSPAATATVEASQDVLLYLRLPNISGFPFDQIETGTLVSGLTLNDKVINVTVKITPGERPAPALKTVMRPLLALSLGMLNKGEYHIKATITGHPTGPLSVEQAFTVK